MQNQASDTPAPGSLLPSDETLRVDVESCCLEALRGGFAHLGWEQVPILPGDVLDRDIEPPLLPEPLKAGAQARRENVAADVAAGPAPV